MVIQRCKGFTLVELMIVVCIVALMAAIAYPKLSDQIRRSQESVTKGNLAALRSALNIYYANTEGQYPADIYDLVYSPERYLDRIPTRYLPPYHPPGNEINQGSSLTVSDREGEWFYFNCPLEPERAGAIVVNCVHADLRGKDWSAF